MAHFLYGYLVHISILKFDVREDFVTKTAVDLTKRCIVNTT